jgi:para-aminobenzoate synthetase component 1
LKLAIYPHRRTSPLADHKTLNYLYYHQAGTWAREQGADEAVVLNPDGTLSETNSASILVVSGKTVIRPRSAHVLPGVMQAEISRRLQAWGFSIEDRPVRPNAIPEADMVLLTNALLGAVPALSLDNRPLKVDLHLAAALNDGLFNEGKEADDLR